MISPALHRDHDIKYLLEVLEILFAFWPAFMFTCRSFCIDVLFLSLFFLFMFSNIQHLLFCSTMLYLRILFSFLSFTAFWNLSYDLLHFGTCDCNGET